MNASPNPLTRRRFFQKSVAALAVAGTSGSQDFIVASPAGRPSNPRPKDTLGTLRITKIVVQNARGRRATPVAPNAYAAFRGYNCTEPLVRIQTNHGLEGVGRAIHAQKRRDLLQKLIGLNPLHLMTWKDGFYAGPAEEHRTLVEGLRGLDMALFDLLGKVREKPVADLLGPRVRSAVHVYDSSLYMEDLLTPDQRSGLTYLAGRRPPSDPAEMVAYKADWLVNDYYKEAGIRLFKIKTGRAKWMETPSAAVQRDIDVFRAVRRAAGPHYTLFVDANNGYNNEPQMARRFMQATTDAQLFGIEEAFQENKIQEHRELVKFSQDLGLRIRNIDGEAGGIPPEILAETVDSPGGTKPLFDINNPSFSHGLGFVQITDSARRCQALDITIGPHNFGSKIGFHASVHTGMAVPNFEYAETDDSEYPGLRLSGVELKNGQATLTGVPGLGIELIEDQLENPALIIA